MIRRLITAICERGVILRFPERIDWLKQVKMGILFGKRRAEAKSGRISRNRDRHPREAFREQVVAGRGPRMGGGTSCRQSEKVRSEAFFGVGSGRGGYEVSE